VFIKLSNSIVDMTSNLLKSLDVTQALSATATPTTAPTL
jgi:hypothetical protein